jgi:thioredoxin-related protein
MAIIKKYVLAEDYNCKKSNHRFAIVPPGLKRIEIRKQYPAMVFSIWECRHCEKIIESV